MKNRLLIKVTFLFFVFFLMNTSVLFAKKDKTILSWEKIPLASAYLIEIKDNKNNIFVKEKIKRNFYDVKSLETGTYFYRLTLFNRLGLAEGTSDWVRFAFQKIAIPQLTSISPNEIPEKKAITIEAEGRLFDSKNSLYMTKLVELEEDSTTKAKKTLAKKKKQKAKEPKEKKINLKNEVLSPTAMKILIPKGVGTGKYNFTFVHKTGEEFPYNIPLTVTQKEKNKRQWLRFRQHLGFFVPLQKPSRGLFSFGFGAEFMAGFRPLQALKSGQGLEFGLGAGIFFLNQITSKKKEAEKVLDFGLLVPAFAYIGYGIDIQKKLEIFPYADMGLDFYLFKLAKIYENLYQKKMVYLLSPKMRTGVLFIVPPKNKVFFSGGLAFSLSFSEKFKFEGLGMYVHFGVGTAF